MITQKELKEITKKEKKKISKEAYSKLKKEINIIIKEKLKNASINADFKGRTIIKSEDIE